jgi:hypothetical protein
MDIDPNIRIDKRTADDAAIAYVQALRTIKLKKDTTATTMDSAAVDAKKRSGAVLLKYLQDEGKHYMPAPNGNGFLVRKAPVADAKLTETVIGRAYLDIHQHPEAAKHCEILLKHIKDLTRDAVRRKEVLVPCDTLPDEIVMAELLAQAGNV